MTNAALIIQQGYRSYCLNKCDKNNQQSKKSCTGVKSMASVSKTERTSADKDFTASSVASNGGTGYSLAGIGGTARNRLEVMGSAVYATASSKEMSPSGPLK